jgi:hypothetical protein
MLQKLILDVAYVAIAIYTCCKPMFQLFRVFQTFVSNISSECFKSRSWCCTCCSGYTCMLQAHVSSVSFGLMLQMFHLNVSKVNQMLHLTVRSVHP